MSENEQTSYRQSFPPQKGDIYQRAWEMVGRSGSRMRGKFPSRKNGRMIHHEGLLELDALYLFETSPHIVSYREQPITIHYPDGDRLRRYTPDFEWVLSTGAMVLIEVKPSRSGHPPQTQHKLDQLTAHLSRSGQPFHLLTETTIRQEPRLSNLRWLYHQAPPIGPTGIAMYNAFDKHRQHFPQSLKTAKTLLAGSGVDVFSLLLAGWLICPLETPVSWDTQIDLMTEADNGWFNILPESRF
jgi:TnsA endonuclease N terminal